MIDHPDLNQFRPNVGVIVFNRAGDVWMGRRMPPKRGVLDAATSWQFPQGGMDKGETPAQTALRELYEETGMKSVRLLMITPGWLMYEFPADYTARKKEKWRGQRQKWAVAVFDGEDDEIDLKAHGEQEFAAWEWAPFDDAGKRIVPFKKAVYDELIESLRPLAVALRSDELC